MGIAIKKLFVLLVMVFVLSPLASAKSIEDITNGSEIPWPYSAQQPMSEENSKGLWWVNTDAGPALFNVEIFDTTKGDSWMRVTEMDPWTYQIRTYGEGFYCNKSEANQGKDGRNVYMFSHIEQDRDPYTLHLAEVDMGWGVVIGLSIYKKEKKADHALGYRQREEPLDCYYPNSSMDLVCEGVAATLITE